MVQRGASPREMVQRGASPRAAATAYGIGQHHMRRLICEGSVTPRAIGRRGIVLFSELVVAHDDYPSVGTQTLAETSARGATDFGSKSS
jgi:hypothetical protein